MQLILAHADLEAALINDLRAKGMTAFEPGKASVEFSFKRGTKELICTLDTEAKAEVHTPVGNVPNPSAEAPVTQVAPVQATEEPVPTAQAEEPVATTGEPVAETPAADGEDDNLFD